MQTRYKRARLSDFLGDYVVYRNLQPADGRLQGLEQIWTLLGMEAYRIPRKVEAEYAQAILRILAQAQTLRGAARPLARLLYIGDTRLLDGTAYRNLRDASGWPGWSFIASEDVAAAPGVEIEGDLYLANRWAALAEFLEFVQGQGLDLNAETVAIIDLDKTALGARGRNHRAVDSARVDGVRRTVEEALGSQFDSEAFREVYDELNQPPYHQFTGDNQDILAYVCLMIVGGVYDYDRLLAATSSSNPITFHEFLEVCHLVLSSDDDRSAALRSVHSEVRANSRRGDPTPFKSFRRREYLTTVARMDFLPDDTPQDRLLSEEITLTREVAEAAHWLTARGVLCFGISDKPDEASLPTRAQQQSAYEALHRTQMKLVGTRLQLGES